MIRKDVLVPAAGFRPTSDAVPVRVSPDTPGFGTDTVAFAGDKDENIGSNDNVSAMVRRTRMGVRVLMSNASA